MHSDPNAVSVFLRDSSGPFAFPDGDKQSLCAKAGQAQFAPAGTHLPEHSGDRRVDGIVVEWEK